MDRTEKLEQAQAFMNEGKLNEAESLIAEIRALDLEKAKEDKPKEDAPKDEAEKPKEEPKASEESKEDNKAPEKDEEKAPKEEPKEEEKPKEKEEKEERSLPLDKENKEMEKVIVDGKEVAKQEKTEVRSFLEYLRSKDVSTRAYDTTGVKSADAAAIIPEEIITKARMLPETVVDLRSKVTTQNVTHAAGSYPILKPNKAILASVEELKANPDLAKPQFDDVDYKVLTYRGQLAVAQEALDDADDNLEGIIARHIQRQGLNTSNAKIAAVLQGATAKAVAGVDDIKTLCNTGFDPAYALEFIVSQSFYNELDKLKDGNGRYLLQDSITAASGKMLLGRNVTVLADTLIGTAVGDKVAFLGDPKAFAVFFNRVEVTARWVEEVYYGQVLAIAMRFDTKMVDAAAGMYLTLTPTPAP